MGRVMEYNDFINSKKHLSGQFGFDPVYMPDMAFDFQKHIIEKAISKGRMGIFADTGLGKTLISISCAINVMMKTNGKVLILTPLAVAFQFIDEAEKIGFDDIEYSKDGKHTKRIVICNYERLHLFDADDFEGVILDESSILKNFKGSIKNQITSFIKKVKYRFLTTATPSPNDFIELGTSSEALGYMGYMDTLGKFFKSNQGSVDSSNRNIGEKFYLKPHAEHAFFQWVNTWSMMVKKPSDIGFNDDRYLLPELIKNKHTVQNKSNISHDGQMEMIKKEAKTFREITHERKQTEQERCEKAGELAQGKVSVYWCNTNAESAMLKNMDKDAVEILGSHSIEKKEETLKAFASGDIDRIITKAKMTGMGLNWQHCNHSVFFPTWSYEQYYQAIRRFWRFGQKRDVTVDMVISEGQTRVMQALEEKAEKANRLYQNLVNNVNSEYLDIIDDSKTKIIKPAF